MVEVSKFFVIIFGKELQENEQDRKCAYGVTLRRVRAGTLFQCENLYSGCVFVAFSFLHLMIMRLISSVARLALPYFHTSSHKLHDFPKKKGFWP